MISIIIPVFNEAETIESLLSYLSANSSSENISEILVVDGDSTDGTRDLVVGFSENSGSNIRLISSEKGRSKQMNSGARNASGNILYFLHADSFPPKGFDTSILTKVEKGNVSGCFRMKFDSDHPLLRFSQWFTQFNFKFCRGGDQSLFVKRDVFEKLNGFNERYIIYEDCEFINRLYDSFNFTIIPNYVITSSRKYSQIGTWKLQYHFAVIHLKKWMGVSPEELYKYYSRNIKA